MFDSLSEQIRHDDARAATTGERLAKWAAIGVAAVVVFGGLILAIQVFA